MDVTISEHIPLKDYTTFKIGGPARFFTIVKTIDELKQAVMFAEVKHLPIFILGGGSNVVISEDGFNGLVIKIEITGITVSEGENNSKEIAVGAGVIWDEFVRFTVENNLYGLENLSLIPGTVGAAPVQNIGAYGTEVKNTLLFVEVFDRETLEIKRLTNEECQFSYRDSIFKKPEGKKYIITRVSFLLPTSGTLNTTYRDIAKYLSERGVAQAELDLKKMRDIVIDIRTKKLPDLKRYGTAGSFFKNPIISKADYEHLLRLYPGMPHFPVSGDENNVKVSAAWILDTVCGFKGYKNNDVGVYENQALVIVNFGNASSQEIKNLAEKMFECVKEKTNIKLEREVRYI